jgi:UDP-N-acetylmuramoylalanine--D-glutamate ligase
MIGDIRRAAIIGLGRSGKAAARALMSLGVSVTAYDAAEPEAEGIPLVSRWDGRLPTGEFDLVVPSPGVQKNHPALHAAAVAGLAIWSEPELGFRFAKAPLWAVTGTNGKSTTAAMIHAIASAAGMKAFFCGNIAGRGLDMPVTTAALEAGPDDLLVAEISSFQLEWVYQFHPRLSVLTNISDDHLARYTGFADYFLTKERLFSAQTPEDLAVVGAECVNSGNAHRIDFGESPTDGDCAFVRDGQMVLRLAGQERGLASVSDVAAPGSYNVLNALAAAAACAGMGLPGEAIRDGLRGFRGLPHRMEVVDTVAGVTFIDNSTCTNPVSAAASMGSLEAPTVVLMGGFDKNLDVVPMVLAARGLPRPPVVYGAIAGRLGGEFEAKGVPHRRAADLAEAFEMAVGVAQPGDAVALIPGCSSFDAYRDFEARADHFRHLVAARKEAVQP